MPGGGYHWVIRASSSVPRQIGLRHPVRRGGGPVTDVEKGSTPCVDALPLGRVGYGRHRVGSPVRSVLSPPGRACSPSAARPASSATRRIWPVVRSLSRWSGCFGGLPGCATHLDY